MGEGLRWGITKPLHSPILYRRESEWERDWWGWGRGGDYKTPALSGDLEETERVSGRAAGLQMFIVNVRTGSTAGEHLRFKGIFWAIDVVEMSSFIS